MPTFDTVELCCGAGGQALGLHGAGFKHVVLVDNDPPCCETIRNCATDWNVEEASISHWQPNGYRGVDLLAAGLPCPPFSKAGKQMGEHDERNLFPDALRLIREIKPKAVMVENVRGLLDPKFIPFRRWFTAELEALGFLCHWQLLQASDFGVPQLRPRVVMVALQRPYSQFFRWPEPYKTPAPTVGEALRDLMGERGWRGVDKWAADANQIAPTLVGGSKKHGGPDLGPTRAKREWAKLGVNAHTLAEFAPDPDFDGMPRLTVRMAARIQGFPGFWKFSGGKTAAYRQVGNAFPPAVAEAVARQVKLALEKKFSNAHLPRSKTVVSQAVA